MSEPVAKPIDKWIPWMFVGFFAMLFAVLGWFTWLAISTFGGVVSDHAYEEGLAYNAVIEAAEDQAARHWSVTVRAEQGRRLIVEARDASGAPVALSQVRALIQRPASDRYDRQVSLAPVQTGRYAVDVPFPLRGAWDVLVTAQSPQGPYRTQARVML